MPLLQTSALMCWSVVLRVTDCTCKYNNFECCVISVLQVPAGAQQEEDKLPFTIPYPPLNTEQAASSDVVTNDSSSTTNTAPVTPKHTIIHRGQMELQDYTTDR